MQHNVHESVLDNGLKVLTVENRISPTASVQVWYRVGSRNERPGITGASHIFEHMMFKGTKRFPKGTFDRIIQDNGMTNNAFTTHDATAYFENMASDRIGIAMELEADRMQGLLLDPVEFESEMSVIREERRTNVEDPPFGLLTEATEATVYMAHPYHWPVIGWMSDLETITREELIAYYQVYYRPNNAVLVVAGDASHKDVLDLAQRYFGEITAGPPIPGVKVQEPPQRGERTVRIHKDVQLPGLIIAYRVIDSVHEDGPALNVIEYLLFRGRSSRLYRKLIYDQSLATSLAGGFYMRRDPSTFFVRAIPQPGIEIEHLRESIITTIESLSASPPMGAEVQKARNQIEADFAFGQEHNFDLGLNLGSQECRSRWEDFYTFMDQCLKIGVDEVVGVAAKYLQERGRTIGYLIPEEGSA
jgi:zinc protease